MKPNVIIINPRDNVAVCLEDVSDGGTISLPGGGEFAALTDIPYSHKVAVRDIPAGEEIIKYGETIGRANTLIRRGMWIHTHNLIVLGKGVGA